MYANTTTTHRTAPYGSISLLRATNPCAACKTLRRRCDEKCFLAPYFPPTDPMKFIIAHQVFGSSNIARMLKELPESQREDAVTSMVYEAKARIRDPVYGCAAIISQLHKQVTEHQTQLANAHAELVHLKFQLASLAAMETSISPQPQQPPLDSMGQHEPCLLRLPTHQPSFANMYSTTVTTTTTTAAMMFTSMIPPSPEFSFPPVVDCPCAACKVLRRRCDDTCFLAPYFPPSEPLTFMTVHHVFGSKSVVKMLRELPESQRADAVSSMVYEANARIRDPVYGCTGIVFQLHEQVNELQAQLANSQAEQLNMQFQQSSLAVQENPNSSQPQSFNNFTYNSEIFSPSFRFFEDISMCGANVNTNDRGNFHEPNDS